MIFDKTGTLTRGTPVLSGVAAVTGVDEREFLGFASAVESDSEHPIAKAIVRGAGRRGVSLQLAVSFESLPGLGARATVNGRIVAVGGPRLLTDRKAVVPPAIS